MDLTSAASFVMSLAAFAASIVSLLNSRATLKHLQAQTGKMKAEEKKTHSEIEWERLDLVVKYWKELSESVSTRLSKVELENEQIRTKQSRQTLAFEYLCSKAVVEYAEWVKIAREIWEGRITQGAG